VHACKQLRQLVSTSFDPSTPHGAVDQRQSSCDLRFGTSTGVLGLRKFPNPRFDALKWEKLNGSRTTWDGYRTVLAANALSPDAPARRLFDASVEPPFRIGMACGACHIGYDPLRPPSDPANPQWENISGLVGNQFSRMSQILGSGLFHHQLEWQLIAQSRPGTVDTSALPMDTVLVRSSDERTARYNFRHRICRSTGAGSDPRRRGSAGCLRRSGVREIEQGTSAALFSAQSQLCPADATLGTDHPP
jgi:hypothetical protein